MSADQQATPVVPPQQDDEYDLSTGDMFAVPGDFYPALPPARTETHTLSNGSVLNLHLVGHSVMDAHRLWNGGRVLADHFLANPSLVSGKTVFEVGAGAGIPSLVAAHLGAAAIVTTDYPDPDVIVALRRNVDECALLETDAQRESVHVDGYVWGKPIDAVLSKMPGRPDAARDGVDVLIMADILFRHSEHENIATTLELSLKRSRDSVAYVFFTSYRPWLREKDLKFFDIARDRGFVVEKILEQKMDHIMFSGGSGDEEVRKLCDGMIVKWSDEKCID